MLKSFSLFFGFVILGACLFYACGSDDEPDLTRDSELTSTDRQTATDSTTSNPTAPVPDEQPTVPVPDEQPAVPIPEERPPIAPKDFGAAPPFQLPDLDGNQVALANFQGQVVAINFWATWCAPCRREIPDFVELQAKHQDKGFTILGISRDIDFDQNGKLTRNEKDVRAFVKEVKVNYPILWDTENVFFESYKGFGMPTTIILDRNHRMRFRHDQIVDKVTFEAEVLKLLNE